VLNLVLPPYLHLPSSGAQAAKSFVTTVQGDESAKWIFFNNVKVPLPSDSEFLIGDRVRVTLRAHADPPVIEITGTTSANTSSDVPTVLPQAVIEEAAPWRVLARSILARLPEIFSESSNLSQALKTWLQTFVGVSDDSSVQSPDLLLPVRIFFSPSTFENPEVFSQVLSLWAEQPSAWKALQDPQNQPRLMWLRLLGGSLANSTRPMAALHDAASLLYTHLINQEAPRALSLFAPYWYVAIPVVQPPFEYARLHFFTDSEGRDKDKRRFSINSAVIELSLETLGPLSITTQLHSSRLMCRVVAAQPETADRLEAERHTLEEALRAVGFEDVMVTVQCGDVEDNPALDALRRRIEGCDTYA
jgi:hypothetical protein